jgi:hypothetical protein
LGSSTLATGSTSESRKNDRSQCMSLSPSTYTKGLMDYLGKLDLLLKRQPAQSFDEALGIAIFAL